MRASLLSLVWVSALVACSDPASYEAARRHRVEVLDRIELRIARAPRSGLTAPAGISPPRASHGEVAVAIRPVVELHADGHLVLDGRTVDEVQLVADLAVLRRNWSLLHPRSPYPNTIAVWADGASTLSEVRRRVSGVSEAAVLLCLDSTPRIPSPPCPEALPESCSWLADRGDRSRRDAAIVRVTREAVGSCRALQALFGEVRSAEAVVRLPVLTSSLVTAARDCPDGSFDVDALEVLVTLLFGEPETYELPLSTLVGSESETLAEVVARSVP